MDIIGNYLQNKITFESLNSISRIAFDFNIEELITKVKEFIDQNFIEITAKSAEELVEMNESTHNCLLRLIVEKLL